MSLMNLGFGTEIGSFQKQVGHERNRRFWTEAGSYSETLILAWIPRILNILSVSIKFWEFLLVHPTGKEAQLIFISFTFFWLKRITDLWKREQTGCLWQNSEILGWCSEVWDW